MVSSGFGLRVSYYLDCQAGVCAAVRSVSTVSRGTVNLKFTYSGLKTLEFGVFVLSLYM